MMIAQQLYEGMEIGNEEPEGLITYMRTDSVNIANEAIEKVRGLIKKNMVRTIYLINLTVLNPKKVPRKLMRPYVPAMFIINPTKSNNT